MNGIHSDKLMPTRCNFCPEIHNRYTSMEVLWSTRCDLEALVHNSAQVTRIDIPPMSLILSIPSELAAELIGTWLRLPDVCRLEVALCSTTNRSEYLAIYKSVAMNITIEYKMSIKYFLGWMISRKISISALDIDNSSYNAYDTWEGKLATILSYSTSLVKYLHVQYAGLECEPVFAALARYCTQIRHIEVSDCGIPPSFYSLLANSKHLTELVIKECEGLQAHLLENVSCPSVQSFCSNKIGDQNVLSALLKCCPNATYCEFVSDDVDLSALPATLEKVTFNSCGSLPSMRANENLRTVSMVDCTTPDEDIFQIFNGCPNLTAIELFNLPFLTSRCIQLIGDKCSRTLEHLYLNHLMGLDGDVLVNLCSRCPVLETLDVADNNHVDSSTILKILDAAPKLPKLRVSGWDITDAVLERIAVSQLGYLGMYDTDGYSEAGIMALIDGCASLHCIEINSEFVNTIVQKLWHRQCPHLTIISEL